MVGNSTPSLQIDLNEFKLHLHLKGRTPLTLHFNSPSRSFYLSVIALVVMEMKKSGKIKSVPLQEHLDLLALLNETVGGAAGSSERENLLHRIYTKWKDALPNLEEAPLFKVHGKKKKEEGDGAIGKVYSFTDAEKDGWANLFDYLGSHENVRLKFAIDKIGIGLNETSIIFGDSVNGEAWDRFISSLKRGGKEESGPMKETVEETAVSEPFEISLSPFREQKISWLFRYRWVVLVVVIGIAGAIWKIFLSPAPIEVASVDRMKYPLLDSPSIAVMPFVNMSDDPQQAYLADGLAEEIINALTKLPKVFVIARSSSFTYKGKTVDVKQVGREMGVRYVLEGSVRRERNRVRITAQLIDATNGNHVFSERYERELKDLFAIQDDVTIKIVSAMRVNLTHGEQERMLAKGTKNLEAYLKILQAYEYYQGIEKEGLAKCKQLAEEAIALDPNYAAAYISLASAIGHQTWRGVYKDPQEALDRAIALGQKAVAMDDSSALIRSRLGWLYTLNQEFDKGVAEAERAIALEPNSAETTYTLAQCLSYARSPEEAIPYFKKAMRLSPIPPWALLHNMAVAYRDSGQYEEAIAMFRKIIQKWPQSVASHIGCAAALAMAGRVEEARVEAAEVMRIEPKFSLGVWTGRFPWNNKARLDRFIEACRKAGLK
jgi:adenylate cyclase